ELGTAATSPGPQFRTFQCGPAPNAWPSGSAPSPAANPSPTCGSDPPIEALGTDPGSMPIRAAEVKPARAAPPRLRAKRDNHDISDLLRLGDQGCGRTVSGTVHVERGSRSHSSMSGRSFHVNGPGRWWGRDRS